MGIEHPQEFANMAFKPPTPKVGVGVIITKLDRSGLLPVPKILLQLRKGSHGPGLWSLPGGHLDIGESFEDCCAREVKEETDLDICDAKYFDITNDIFREEGLHYVTLYFTAMVNEDQEFKIMEPSKCEDMKWFNETHLPENLFLPFKNLLLKRGSMSIWM